MKITVTHLPKSAHIARLAGHSTLWPAIPLFGRTRGVHALATIKLSPRVQKCWVIKMAKCARKRNTAVGSSDGSKTKWLKRQVSKETFLNWQRIYEREHQSMVWLRADMDDQDRSIVSTLRCVVVESTKLGCVGSNTAPQHGSMVLATIRQAECHWSRQFMQQMH